MRLSLLCLIALTALVCTSATYADELPQIDLGTAIAAASGDLVIPPEWSGIWLLNEEEGDCGGVLDPLPAELDTLCAGDAYELEEEPGVDFSCVGTVTATTFDIECTGSVELFPDCLATFTIDTIGTRTGETYEATQTVSATFTGTDPECELLPDFCRVVETSATRTGPQPAECATPVNPVSWAHVKAVYRD